MCAPFSASTAEQTAIAVAAKMRGDLADSRVAFELADALHAAIAEIDHEDTDENGVLVPGERLGVDEANSRPIETRTKPTTK